MLLECSAESQISSTDEPWALRTFMVMIIEARRMLALSVCAVSLKLVPTTLLRTVPRASALGLLVLDWDFVPTGVPMMTATAAGIVFRRDRSPVLHAVEAVGVRARLIALLWVQLQLLHPLGKDFLQKVRVARVRPVEHINDCSYEWNCPNSRISAHVQRHQSMVSFTKTTSNLASPYDHDVRYKAINAITEPIWIVSMSVSLNKA